MAEAVLRSMEKTAETAHARQDMHEAVCAERYKNIEKSMGEIKSLVLAQGTDMHGRLNTISSRMWAAVVGTLGVTVVGFGSLALYLLTKK